MHAKMGELTRDDSHDHAAAEKANTGYDIGGNLRDARGAVSGEHAECDEQTRAARDQRDGAQACVALAHLPFEADRDTAAEGG
jgi:hypothetical protein